MSPTSLRRSWNTYLPASTPFIARMLVGTGLLLLALAAGFALHTAWSVRSFIRTKATVTANVAMQDAQGNVFYITHLRLQIPGGRSINFIDPIRSSENGDPGFAAGQIVPVLYPFGHLEDARIATTWRLYFIANVFGILGVIFVDLGLVLCLALRRISRKNPLQVLKT